MTEKSLQRSFIGGEMAQRMFGRPDDPRFQHGAAKLQNMRVTPQGPAKKRPGTDFVIEIKDSDNEARLLPFTFSQEDTNAIEMGRATVSGREIGYLRFHTDGGTVLYPPVRVYQAPAGITAIVTDTFTATSHGFITGDPVVLTMHPTDLTGQAVTFDDHPTAPGDVDWVAHGLGLGQEVIFEEDSGGGSLPPELEARKLYYVAGLAPFADSFNVSESRNGNGIVFTGSGSATVRIAAMPWVSLTVDDQLTARRTYYLIRIDDDTFKLAVTKEDALAGTAMSYASVGTGHAHNDIRVHYDDRVGDLVESSNAVWYCFRRPMTGVTTNFLTLGDHLGHATTDVNFWVLEPGEQQTVTFDTGDNEVDLATHGYANGDTVIFSTTGALPGLTAGTTYYIVNKDTNDFQVAATKGGTFIALSGGSGTHKIAQNSIFEAPHFFDFDELLEVGYGQSKDVITLTHRNRPAIELRRFGATSWEVREIPFNSAPAPSDVLVTAARGFSYEVSAFSSAAVCDILTGHDILVGETVMALSLGDLADGLYSVIAKAGGTVTLGELDTQNAFSGLATTVTSGLSKVQPVSAASLEDEVYVVTAITSSGEESQTSQEFALLNNLLVAGSYNDITWGAVAGAVRYVIYKKVIGLFGVIGTVEAPTLTFRDENIAPDSSKTSPIIDDSLRRVMVVTFDTSNFYVEWEDHGLIAGSPVTFQSSDALPAALTDYKTYWVVNPEKHSFQVAATVGGAPVDLVTNSTLVTERHEATAGLFPNSVGYYEQRKIFAGSVVEPQRVWMTVTGTELDMHFTIPVVDSNRIQIEVSSGEAGGLRHVLALAHLMILGESTEYRLTPINDDALTPTSISVRPRHVGASVAHPVVVGDSGIYAASRGGHLRETGFNQGALQSYLTGDLSLRATHLFDSLTIKQLAYAKAPTPTIYAVSSNGDLLGMTYLPEEQIGAWYHFTTDGTFESCVVISEGGEDRLYVIVKRNINGNDVRYVERLNDLEESVLADGVYMDSAATYDDPVAATVITGLDHLEAEVVAVLADGLVVTPRPTVASGSITLAIAAKKVHVGIPFTGEIKSLPMARLGLQKNVSDVQALVEKSGAFQLGPDADNLRPSEKPDPGDLLTDSIDVPIDGAWGPHGQVLIRSSDPLPLTVVWVTYDTAPGG